MSAPQGIIVSPPPSLFVRLGFPEIEIEQNVAGKIVAAGKGTGIPYWSIVIPLTALSAWLLISTRRPKNTLGKPSAMED